MRVLGTLPFLILAVSGCAVQQSATDLASPASPESTVLSAVTRLPTASSTVSPAASPEPTRTSTPVSTATIAPQPTAAPSPMSAVMWNGLVVKPRTDAPPMILTITHTPSPWKNESWRKLVGLSTAPTLVHTSRAQEKLTSSTSWHGQRPTTAAFARLTMRERGSSHQTC